MLSCHCQFPHLALDPVPFYKHPYKMFALAQVTFLFWRTVQLLSYKEGDEWQKAKAALFVIPHCQNFGCLILGELNGFHSQRLGEVVKCAFLLQYINFLDAFLPDNLNLLGDAALTIRVAILGVTTVLMCGLIHVANNDRPYRAQLVS